LAIELFWYCCKFSWSSSQIFIEAHSLDWDIFTCRAIYTTILRLLLNFICQIYQFYWWFLQVYQKIFTFTQKESYWSCSRLIVLKNLKKSRFLLFTYHFLNKLKGLFSIQRDLHVIFVLIHLIFIFIFKKSKIELMPDSCIWFATDFMGISAVAKVSFFAIPNPNYH